MIKPLPSRIIGLFQSLPVVALGFISCLHCALPNKLLGMQEGDLSASSAGPATSLMANNLSQSLSTTSSGEDRQGCTQMEVPLRWGGRRRLGGNGTWRTKPKKEPVLCISAYLPHTTSMPVQMPPTYTMQRKTIFISDAYDG